MCGRVNKVPSIYEDTDRTVRRGRLKFHDTHHGLVCPGVGLKIGDRMYQYGWTGR